MHTPDSNRNGSVSPTQAQVNSYLDALRESGVVNMFGAAPYLKDRWPVLSDSQARAMLVEWMQTYGERRQ